MQEQPQDRKTIFETLSLPVAKIQSPVARQATTTIAAEIIAQLIRNQLCNVNINYITGQLTQNNCVM